MRSVADRIPGDAVPMTGRARAYLWIGSARTLPVAFFCFLSAPVFSSPAFEFLLSAAPLWGWGVVLTVSGLLFMAAALSRREWLARIALIIGAAHTACWALAFAFAASKGNVVSPLGITWGLALAAKDLVVCRQPLWSPFEQLIAKVTAGERLRTPSTRGV